MLVAYASKHGSTREVAEAVAGALRRSGHDVDLRPAREVDGVDGYDAVVLGAPLYVGRWHREATAFLKRHRRALAAKPVAIFALGPLKDTEEERADARAQLDRALEKVPEVEPLAVIVFGGAIEPATLRFPFNRMPRTDIRDWDAIAAWAEGLPVELALHPRPARVAG